MKSSRELRGIEGRCEIPIKDTLLSEILSLVRRKIKISIPNGIVAPLPAPPC
jgi:hypothetical protein